MKLLEKAPDFRTVGSKQNAECLNKQIALIGELC